MCMLLVLLGLLLYVIVIPLNEEVGMSLPPLLQTTYQMPSSLHTSHKHFILMPSPTDHPGQTFGCTVLLIPAEESPSAANVIELLCVFCEQKDKCSTAIEIPILHLPPILHYCFSSVAQTVDFSHEFCLHPHEVVFYFFQVLL